MRCALHATVSLAVAAGLNFLAIHYRANLYAAYTSLSQSNGGLLILLNVLLLYTSLVVCGLQYLLYGPLGFLEIEELYERFIITTIETILAAFILRLEIDGCYMLMFVGILAGKVWIWMGEGRLETHEQQPFLTSKVRCARFSIALLLSVSFDVFMVMYAVRAIRLTTGPSMMLLGALDFGVMTISSVSTAIHFAFSVAATVIIERRSQEVGTLTWDEKYRWMTSLSLTTDFIKMLGYLLYLYIHLSTSGVPIQIIRDTFLTGRSFAKRV